jgi:CheY-like chemotaxis protein
VILVVDDYADGGKALCLILQGKGCPSQWVSSGADALAMMRAHPPEQPLLVVLDDMMPHLRGVDVLKIIRNDPLLKTTTVIMYSAGFDLEKRDEALALGAAAWILKGGTAGAGIETAIDSIVHWYLKVGGVQLKSEKAKADAAIRDVDPTKPS